MSEAMVMSLTRQSLETLLTITTPMLIVGMIVGIAISILQVLTSIQYATLAFVPRAIAVFVVFLLSLPWIVHKFAAYTISLYSNFGQYIR